MGLYRKRDGHKTPIFYDGELEEPAKETEMRTFIVERRSRRSQETGDLSKGVSVNRCFEGGHDKDGKESIGSDHLEATVFVISPIDAAK